MKTTENSSHDFKEEIKRLFSGMLLGSLFFLTSFNVYAQPTAFSVTGGGSYCVGGEGVPVGLSDSEIGVTYTLLKNSIPQLPDINGTGEAITFGNQLAGTYTISGTNGDGTTPMTGNAVVIENPLPETPAITPSGPTTFCAGGSVTLSSSPGITYLWSTGATTQTIDVNVSGSFTVQVADGFGCQSAPSAETVITVNPLPETPIITPSGPTTFCAGGSVTLSSNPGTTYLWSTGETTQTIDVAESGSYTVQVTDGNGCQSAPSAETVVTVNPLPETPTITPSGPTTFCAGETVTLSSSPGTTYLWSTGETTQTIDVTVSGSYTVQVTDGNGCQSTPSTPIIVTVDQLPTVATIATTPLDYCGTLVSGSLGGNTPTIGTGTWSIVSGGKGTFSDEGSGNSTFAADAYGTYVLRWTISNGTCTPSSADVTVNFEKNFTASFVSGWNWFSVNTLHADMSLNNILSAGFTDGDYIKNQTSFAFYSSIEGWVGSFNSIDPKNLYIIRVENPAEIDFCGTPVSINSTPIPVVAGWNWVGYTPAYSLPLSGALSSLPIVTGDYIKNQTGFAEYFSTSWFGSLGNLNPGEGYMLNLTNPGTLTYPDSPAKSIPELSLNQPDNSFSPNKYEFNGSVTANVLVNDIPARSEKDRLYAYVDDEIRGIANGLYLDFQDSYIFPLMIFSNKPDGDIVHFKYYNSENNKFYECLENIPFKTDMIISSPFKSFRMNVVSERKSAMDNVSSDIQLTTYPNPFKDILNIGFTVPELTDVRVTVSDQYGNILRVLIDQELNPDNYTIQWTCEAEPAGIYIIRIQAGNRFIVRKVLLIP